MRIIKPGLLLLASFLLHGLVFSQSQMVQGILKDSSDNKSTQNTVIALLRAQDSTLAGYTRAGADGAFSLNKPDTGKFILMITHPYFAEYFDTLPQSTEKTIDLGIVQMLSKIKLMEEVIVKGNRAMFMSGDTTVFTADSFKVREGANVEELFRKLPGFKVDRNGQITALGKKVERLLVDGEEFFGDDPGIASKNLRADNVKEVQVYEGKSDQAAFTGIDDGQSKQTINLKLKEDRKKGYFGKIELGGGLKGKQPGEQDKFSNALMVNAFKGKRKIAAYGIMSNTGQLNLNWADRDKFGSSSSGVEIADNGDMNFSWNGDDYNSSDGIPTNWNGGLHYSNRFNEDKLGVNLGYRYVKINSPITLQTFGVNYLQDSVWKTNERNDEFNTSTKNAANFKFDIKLDSMNTLKWTGNGNINNSQAQSVFRGEALQNDNNQTIYTNDRRGDNHSDNRRFNSNLLWMHKFKKLYRTLSVNLGGQMSETKTTELLNSNLVRFSQGDSISSTKIDQKTLGNYEGKSMDARLAYTEPLLKDVYMELNYTFRTSQTTNHREVNARNDLSGQYDQFKDSLSNNFLYKTLANSPGVSIKMNKKKYNITVGGVVGFTQSEQENLTNTLTRPYNYINYNPFTNIRYNFSQSSRFGFNYYGYTNAPSLNDLQPIVTNNDPLNIKVGNQSLKASFSHNLNAYFSSFRMSNERSIWANIRYGFTNNAFTNYSSFANSIRKYYTVNTNGVSYFSTNGDYSIKLMKVGIRLGAGANMNINQNVDFIADDNQQMLKNITRNNNYTFNLSIGKDVADKYYINFSPNIGYNTSAGTVNKLSNAAYWSTGFGVYGNLKFGKEWELNTDVNGQYRQKDPRFPSNNNFTIWNGSLSKKIHKKEFEFKLSVYDILDQNRGYSQNRSNYSFTDSYRNTLRRLWLVSFIWNITKNGEAPAK